jgi:hypothetical protein
MKGILLQLCLFFSLVLTGYSLTATTATSRAMNSEWSILTLDDVDAGFYVHHSYTAIAVDDADHVHISYRGPGYDLRYATNETGCWVTEVVYDVSVNVARENSIAVDSSNDPHISFSFRDGGNENLMYAKKITTTWGIETIDDGPSVGMENDIAVDDDDKVHISHWQWNGANLRYATNGSGVWEPGEVANHASWDRTAIAMDSHNNPYIVYNDFGAITYATNLSGTWVITDTELNGSSPAIVIDSNDKIHVSYASGSDLKYTTNTSGQWETTTIAGGVNPGRYHAIAVDLDNKVHISYYNSSEGDLEYASNVTGAWLTRKVDTARDVGRSNSIAIDSQGNVHLSYRDDGANKLKYATNATAAPPTYPVYLPLIMRNS